MSRVSKFYFEIGDLHGAAEPCICKECREHAVGGEKVHGRYYIDHYLIRGMLEMVENGWPLQFGETTITSAVGMEATAALTSLLAAANAPPKLGALACQAVIRKIPSITAVKHWYEGFSINKGFDAPEQNLVENINALPLLLTRTIKAQIHERIHKSVIFERNIPVEKNEMAFYASTFLSMLFSHAKFDRIVKLVKVDVTFGELTADDHGHIPGYGILDVERRERERREREEREAVLQAERRASEAERRLREEIWRERVRAQPAGDAEMADDYIDSVEMDHRLNDIQEIIDDEEMDEVIRGNNLIPFAAGDGHSPQVSESEMDEMDSESDEMEEL